LRTTGADSSHSAYATARFAYPCPALKNYWTGCIVRSTFEITELVQELFDVSFGALDKRTFRWCRQSVMRWCLLPPGYSVLTCAVQPTTLRGYTAGDDCGRAVQVTEAADRRERALQQQLESVRVRGVDAPRAATAAAEAAAQQVEEVRTRYQQQVQRLQSQLEAERAKHALCDSGAALPQSARMSGVLAQVLCIVAP
jgi:hypothetical protein